MKLIGNKLVELDVGQYKVCFYEGKAYSVKKWIAETARRKGYWRGVNAVRGATSGRAPGRNVEYDNVVERARNKVIREEIVVVRGVRWKISEAKNFQEALSAIDFASVTGAVGTTTRKDNVVVANVVKVNLDGSEVQPS